MKMSECFRDLHSIIQVSEQNNDDPIVVRRINTSDGPIYQQIVSIEYVPDLEAFVVLNTVEVSGKNQLCLSEFFDWIKGFNRSHPTLKVYFDKKNKTELVKIEVGYLDNLFKMVVLEGESNEYYSGE